LAISGGGGSLRLWVWSLEHGDTDWRMIATLDGRFHGRGINHLGGT
jgi:hypothetical protein